MCKENSAEQNMPLENAVVENDAEFEVILYFFPLKHNYSFDSFEFIFRM